MFGLNWLECGFSLGRIHFCICFVYSEGVGDFHHYHFNNILNPNHFPHLVESSLIVRDSDVLLLVRGHILRTDVQNTIGINIEGDLNLRNTTRRRRDSGELEFTELMVVLGHLTFTLKNLNEHATLVILVSGEGLFLLGGDSGVTLDELSHDTTSSLETEGERSDIEKEQVIDSLSSLVGKDSGLHGGTVSDGLIRVDGSVGFLSVEEFLEELLDLGDTSGTTDENDFVDGALIQFGIAESFLDRGHSRSEEFHVQFLESRTREHISVVNSIEQRIDLDSGLSRTRQSPLGALALSPQTTEGTLVSADILSVLPLKIGNAVLNHLVIEILSSEMRITSGRFDFEDTLRVWK